MGNSVHAMIAITWFCLIGLMLAVYVIADGFDLGIGILSLLKSSSEDRGSMVATIGPVWDANETWLVVLGGALFGAFPTAYALLMQGLYVPVMALIAGLIMRGAAIEFRHSAKHGRLWDRLFGMGSLVAAAAQGVTLGNVITGLAPGVQNVLFVTLTAVGVVTGYCLLGATYLIKKTVGTVEQWSRRLALLSAILSAACALALTLGTALCSTAAHGRWADVAIFHILIGLGIAAALAFATIVALLYLGSRNGPFYASVALFLISFLGLTLSLFPDVIPGKLNIIEAASEPRTLVFMLIGIGLLLPVMIGYNLYQYHIFRGEAGGETNVAQ
jgi:cytochrome d ubiquinol oxidase subunit II